MAEQALAERVAEALKRDFGYVEEQGEKWCVYQDRLLIVTHPYRLIRVYRYQSGMPYTEIDPTVGLGAL